LELLVALFFTEWSSKYDSIACSITEGTAVGQQLANHILVGKHVGIMY
jgi:hypothetical protein